LPSSWGWASLDRLVEVNPKLDKSQYDDELEVSFVPMPAVEAETGQIDVSETKKFSEVKKGYTAFQENDVLFAKITPCMENGKMAVVPSVRNDLGFGSTEFHVLRSPGGISPQYIYYYVSSKLFRIEAEHNMSGAVGQRRVPAPWLSSTELPVPPSKEQHRIVEKIEELFSELDKGIESLKTAREQLKVYRQALLKHAFEGKLTEEWRKENTDKLESADQLLERIKKEREACYQQQLDKWQEAVRQWEADGKRGKKPRAPKKINNDLEIIKLNTPREWLAINLGFATTLLGDGLHGTPKYDEGGEYHFINGNNLDNGKIVLKGNTKRVSEEEYNKYKKELNDKTVLVSINGTIGNTAFYNGEKVVLGKSACYFNLLPCVNKHYIRFLLTGVGFLNYALREATGSTIKNVQLKAMRSFGFPLCSEPEQEKVVNLLEMHLSVLDKQESDIEVNLRLSETLRQAILQKAFSGQLVPQNSNDEPASVLLERIAAEKVEAVAKQKKAPRKRRTKKELQQ